MKKRLAWKAVAAQDAVEFAELLRAKLRVRARLDESTGRGSTASTKVGVK